MVELAQERGCLVRRLLSHFGEELPGDCGHCSNCAGEPTGEFRPAKVAEVKVDGPALRTLRAEHPRALGSPRQLARFLCGLTSPSMVSAKLTRHAAFGSYAAVPFQAVLAAVTRSADRT